jgi:hypothetical protein
VIAGIKRSGIGMIGAEKLRSPVKALSGRINTPLGQKFAGTSNSKTWS